MDLIPPETFLSILGHLSERDRLRLLSTCKRMRVWLQKRQSAALAAFNAFKTQRLTVSNWYLVDDLAVRDYGTFSNGRGTRRWSCTVSLEENSLISIVWAERFTMRGGVSLPELTTTRLFSPWFHTMTSWRGRDTRIGVPDDNLQMLLSVSHRLG
jgi:hypothetical protein